MTKKNKDAWELLFAGIAVSQSLQVLRINHCTVGQEVISAMAEAFRSNQSLKVLDLGYCNIPDKLGPSLVTLIKD